MEKVSAVMAFPRNNADFEILKFSSLLGAFWLAGLKATF
jgi:hypothetical protein